MNINIKNHIINNFKNSNEKEIKESIEDSLKDEEEITLPGLGVFFTLLWQNSKEEEKEKIIKTIHKKIHQ